MENLSLGVLVLEHQTNLLGLSVFLTVTAFPIKPSTEGCTSYVMLALGAKTKSSNTTNLGLQTKGTAVQSFRSVAKHLLHGSPCWRLIDATFQV